MHISIVIPAYNESENIKISIQELFSTLKKISDINGVEIIVVDDHSSDNTYDIIKNINDARIKSLRLSRRCGSHIALRAGIKESVGDVILCISADGQDDPNVLGKMLDKWRSGKKIVWAARRSRHNENWLMRLSAKLFYSFLLWLVDVKDMPADLSRVDFYLLDKIVVDAINSCPEANTSLFGLIAWLGFSQDVVEYDRRLRRQGHSKWSFRNRLGLAKDWIIAFSGLPLKIVSIIGFFIAAIGIIYVIYIIFYILIISPHSGIKAIPGWASTISVVLILGGFQMIILGVIGEYLWRNLNESRRRPLYFIEATTGNIDKKIVKQ